MARTKGTRRKFITPDMYEKLETMAACGLTEDQMCAIIGIGETTLDKREIEQPEIKRVIERGRARAIRQVGSTAFQMAISGKVPAMTMFYLKCRARWTETQVIEHTGKDGKPIEMQSPDLKTITQDDETLKAALLVAEKLNAKGKLKSDG